MPTPAPTPTATPSPLLSPLEWRSNLVSLTEASSAWFQSHWLAIAISVAVGTVIVIALSALRGYASRWVKPDAVAATWPSVFAHAMTRTNNFFIIAAAAKIVDGYAHAPVEVTQTINFLFTIAAGFQVAIWVREIVLGVIEHRANRENYRGETIVNAMGIIRLLVTIALFGMAVIVILGNLGINVTGLVAGLGVGGIAIGLAAQGIFADLFAALAIIFDRPFSKGDAIAYDDTQGTVEEIGLKSTRIRSITGEERVIANKQLLDKEIQNNSRRSVRRMKFPIGIIYQTQPAVALAVPKLLEDIVKEAGATFVRAGFVGFGDSSLNFELEFDCNPVFDEAYLMRHTVGLAILNRFKDEGIEFAYPTQTSFTAAPDGTMTLPYPQGQAVKRIDLKQREA